MSITNTDLVNKIKNIASNYNTVYFWGGTGHKITDANIKSKANQYPSWYTQDKLNIYYPLVGNNYWGFDCVNLIKGVVWGWDGSLDNGGISYASNGCPDYGANGMINYCTGVSTDFSKVELGEALWCEGHFGIYVGNGFSIEATPRWGYTPGVKVTAVANMGLQPNYERQRQWTKHGFMPYVTYSGIDTGNYTPSPDRILSDTDYSGALSTGGTITPSYSFTYDEYETVNNLSTQPFHAFVELWIGNTHVPPIPPQYLISFEITSLTENGADSSDSASEAVITLFDKYCDELEYLFINNANDIKIRFGHVSGRQSTTVSLIATEYSINFTPKGNILTVKFKPGSLVAGNSNLSSSCGSSPSEAVRIICDKVGWKIGRIDDSIQLQGQGGEYIEFNMINDKPLDYIRNTVAPRAVRPSDGKGGFIFYLDETTTPNTAYFHPIDLQSGGLRTYVYQKGKNSPIISFDLNTTIKLTAAGVSQYISSGIDPLTKDQFNLITNNSEIVRSAVSDKSAIEDTDNPKVDVTDNLSSEEISAITSYRFTNQATIGENAVNGTLTIIGDPTIARADSIRVIILNNDNSMHNLSGLYFVNGVNHQISSGTMLTTLSVYRYGDTEGTVTLKSAQVVK